THGATLCPYTPLFRSTPSRVALPDEPGENRGMITRDFSAIPPRRPARLAPAAPAGRWEYKTVFVKNRWSRRRQDWFLNRFAAEGWEIQSREPRGGLFGGGTDVVTLRRRR